jgi:hypothetical protein
MKIQIFFRNALILVIFGLFTGCSEYLDVVPDNVATLDHAFSNRNMAQRFLFTCYWYMPDIPHWRLNPAFFADELMWNVDEGYADSDCALFSAGSQNTSNPYMNFWDGTRNGKNLFIALRDCNIFLENIHQPIDMTEYERTQWIAEAKALKAYYHFYLLQMYGPIPIIKENLPVNSSTDEVRVFRDPVDDVVDYIVQLIDEALPDLMPNSEFTREMDAGRITQPIAASIKAKALVLGASPLFNGNPDYVSFKDSRGIQLVSSDFDATKWTRAAEAVKDAIDICHDAGHEFYYYTPTRQTSAMSPETKLKVSLRVPITEKFNSEIIWPALNTTSEMDRNGSANFGIFTSSYSPSEIGPTLNVAEEFYTRNGLPIDEDPEWINWVGDNFNMRYLPLVASTAAGTGIDGVTSLSEDHKYYIVSTNLPADATAKLHFYREPRFYAWVGFDRCIWELNETGFRDPGQPIKARAGEDQGMMSGSRHQTCGYFTKKHTNIETIKNAGGSSGITQIRYTFPIIRLSDLYLLYAEALNESKAAPDNEVYQWIDVVRERAGLPTVQDAYANAIPSARNKPKTKSGMRDIIKRERLIELSFEFWRYWDLVRWKDAAEYMSKPIRGWNYKGMSVESYYTVNNYLNRDFETKDYLWPIRLENIQVNSNLVQNPGW